MGRPRRVVLAVGVMTAVALVAAGVLGRVRSRAGADPATEADGGVDRMGLPSVMLWAWERPEAFGDLRGRAGVAWLAATIELRGDGVRVARRRQPLEVVPGTALLPVVRIESDHDLPPSLCAEQRRLTVAVLESVLDAAGGEAVQVDFEATRSQRDFERALLDELRARRGARLRLSITALGSWCFDDGWVRDLPVDEVVAMMYRLGRDRDPLLGRLARDGRFPVAKCRLAIGLSSDAARPTRMPNGRRYHFHPRSWDAAAVAKALDEAR